MPVEETTGFLTLLTYSNKDQSSFTLVQRGHSGITIVSVAYK